MIITGIDPGTVALGYGIIEKNADRLNVISYGVIKTPAKSSVESKLSHIYKELSRIFDEYIPAQVALEEPFVSNNVRVAISIGRAQAIAILTAALRNIPIYRYSPLQVKLQVTSYGASSKSQVNEMVKIQLGIRGSTIAEDAADALAVALCHINQSHLAEMVQKEDAGRRG